MQVAIVTVGDELLAGETENTNATWLARQLTERGAAVVRSLSVPDDPEAIGRFVREWADAFDAVVVTGGLGGTPDDVTMEAVARAMDRDLVVDEAARAELVEKARAFREENPGVFESREFDPDYDAMASRPEGGRSIPNTAGWVPGAVVGNVYVFPGIPAEMRAMFDAVADEFAGDVTSETVYTSEPEGALYGRLDEAHDRFDVAVGSYPTPLGVPAKVKVTGTDADEVAAAADWLRERIDVTDPPADGADG